jgi:hypothetical protein
MNSMIFLLISNEFKLWHEIDAAAQPLPRGDLGGADFTENANACPSGTRQDVVRAARL